MKISDYSCKFYNGSQIINNYLSDVRKFKVLTPEQEVEMCKKAKEGDMQAKDELIARNQRFIFSLAKIYSKNEDEVLDYVNEGNIGLIMALESFNPELGNKFLTHAVWYVRRQMNYYLTNTNNLINKSNNMKLGKKIDAVKQMFFNENGYMPTEEEIIDLIQEKYNIEVKDVSDVYNLDVQSISAELDDDYTVEENSEYNDKTSSINEYESESENEYAGLLVKNILSTLNDKQRDIIQMFFGIGYERNYSAREIGNKYKMDEMTINELKNKIINYLRDNRGEYKLAI